MCVVDRSQKEYSFKQWRARLELLTAECTELEDTWIFVNQFILNVGILKFRTLKPKRRMLFIFASRRFDTGSRCRETLQLFRPLR